jgi:hypothetical protein
MSRQQEIWCLCGKKELRLEMIESGSKENVGWQANL